MNKHLFQGLTLAVVALAVGVSSLPILTPRTEVAFASETLARPPKLSEETITRKYDPCGEAKSKLTSKEIKTDFKSQIKSANAAHQVAVKQAKADFNAARKLAEKTFLDALKEVETAQAKEAIKKAYKETLSELQVIRKEAIESANTARQEQQALVKEMRKARQAEVDSKKTDSSKQPCVKGASTSEVRTCVARVKADVKEAVNWLNDAYKEFKRGEHTPAELREAKIEYRAYLAAIKKYGRDEEAYCRHRTTTTETPSTPDAERIAHIRQLASALELYYNDVGMYAPALTNLVPAYISTLPTPPKKISGKCKRADNVYRYTQISGNSYELRFCIGKATGGLTAGKHVLTEQGIY